MGEFALGGLPQWVGLGEACKAAAQGEGVEGGVV